MGMTNSKKKSALARRIRRWKRRMLRRHAWAGTLFAVLEGFAGFAAVAGVAAVVLACFWPRLTGRPASPSATMAPVEIAAPPMDTDAPADTDTPVDTDAPADTDAPLDTDAPVDTDAPADTDAPVDTDAPADTDTPSDTDAPEETVVPVLPEETERTALLPEATMETEAEATAEVGAYYQLAAAGADYSDPAQNNLIRSKVYTGSTKTADYVREDEIHMGASTEYTALEGVTTFRGSNYRDGGSYGVIPESPSSLSVIWMNRISGLDGWTGVGWTGQASAVCWPEETRQIMNIVPEKKAKDGLVEVLYATLDGHIYFLDLDDGAATREAINIGAPIKGSLSVDPRGYPLLYCGQGIYDVNGQRMKCGTRIWSLIDQSLLYMINGADDLALRAWRAFDCSPLVDGATDTLIQNGENGVLYTVDLNTRFDGSSISIDPEIVRYVYEQSIDSKLGSENSFSVYNNYIYFATNVGIIQCVDLNTMTPVWTFNAQDDIDASLVIEVEPDGSVSLYATNELDKRGNRGSCQMFKLNALTGELLWKRDSDTIYQNDENGGGSFATPAVGRNNLSDLVYFHVARTVDSKGMLYALDKSTGDVVWSYAMGSYGWSSPTIVYTPPASATSSSAAPTAFSASSTASPAASSPPPTSKPTSKAPPSSTTTPSSSAPAAQESTV